MLASFDIGSNTVRCLVGTVEQGRVEPQVYLRQITRLGGGFTPKAGLAPPAIDRTCRAIAEMHKSLSPHRPQQIRAVGTQALRQASNAGQLVERVWQETGIRIDIISGDEEARLGAAGILSALAPLPETCLFFDIGGGSTEFGVVQSAQLVYFRSFPVGVVRLTEDCADAADRAAVTRQALDALHADLEQRLLADAIADPGAVFVGTAGTVTTLAALELGMTQYDWRRVNNFSLSRRRLGEWLHRLRPMSPTEREAVPGMEPGRGDLILPGLEWINAILDRSSRPSLTISDFGLLEGVLLGMAKQSSIDS